MKLEDTISMTIITVVGILCLTGLVAWMIYLTPVDRRAINCEPEKEQHD